MLNSLKTADGGCDIAGVHGAEPASRRMLQQSAAPWPLLASPQRARTRPRTPIHSHELSMRGCLPAVAGIDVRYADVAQGVTFTW